MKSIFIQTLLDAAANNASKTAIVDQGGNRQTTYAELLNLAHRVTAYIQSRGVEPQTFIAVKMPYCMEYLAAEIGIWLSRCVAVPIGVSYPASRIDYIMKHSESPLMLTLDEIEEIGKMDPIEGVIPSNSDNALILYTSGSTGNPKGALITFGPLDNDVPRLLAPGVSMKNVVFGISAPLYFAFGNNIWDALHAGGTVHMYSDEVKSNITLMEDYILEHGITISQISPAALRLFHNKSPKLKTVITAGEKLTTQYSKDGYTLFNLYGQTEALHAIIGYKMPEHPLDIIPIGKCLHGIEAMVADEDGKPLPLGETGEMCLRGPLFKEYYKEPALTAETYHDGWLHTKDLIYIDENGDIIYVNRKDWMVKVNGQRVEPGEVEAAINNIDGVTGAIVKGFDNDAGSQYLCAYFTTDSAIDGEMIRQRLTQCLPSYMVPSYYVKVDNFPLNANGKIDRKSLQAPDTNSLKEEYVAPTNEVEAVLCDAFAKVLGLDKVGVNDDFFRLGGNSIQMMRIQQLCASSTIDVLHMMSTKHIHQGRTPKKIAEKLLAGGIRVKPQLEDYPLSGIQNSYLQICLSCEGLPVFNVSNLVKLGDKVDLNRLAAAIQLVVANHKGLHTRLFRNAEGEVRQKSVPEPFALPVEKITPAAFEAEKKLLVQPFYLLKDKLFRFRLFDTGEAKYLFYDIHHIIYDGASQIILLNEIEQTYQGKSIEAEDWNSLEMSAEEHSIRQTPVLAKAKEWYHQTYSDAKSISRPDLGPGASPKLTDTVTELNIPVAEVENFCHASGVTVNELTTAAYALMLGQYADATDVVFASAYNAREDSRVRNTVGLFARPLFVRARWSDNMQTDAFLKTMRNTLLECMDNSIYSYAEMQQDIPMAPGYLFIYQGELTAEPIIGGQPSKTIEITEKQAISAIECHLFLDKIENRFKLQILYKQDYFEQDFINRMISNYQNVLQKLMGAASLSEIICDVDPNSKL